MVENLNPERGVLGKEIEVGRDGFGFLDAMSLSSFKLKKKSVEWTSGIQLVTCSDNEMRKGNQTGKKEKASNWSIIR